MYWRNKLSQNEEQDQGGEAEDEESDEKTTWSIVMIIVAGIVDGHSSPFGKAAHPPAIHPRRRQEQQHTASGREGDQHLTDDTIDQETSQAEGDGEEPDLADGIEDVHRIFLSFL